MAMHIILGATGHVGSVAARNLLARGEPVAIVTRDRSKGAALEQAGARIAVADVHDVSAMQAIFRTGRRAFLLNPPADVSANTDVEERRTAAAIAAAVTDSGLEKLVVQSAYGARPGGSCGDLTILFELEQAVQGKSIPVAINRAAYYFTNWDAQAGAVRERGILQSFFPADFAMPMVSPQDLGAAAARRLIEPAALAGIHNVEGPRRYSAQDVADAFATSLGRPVKVEVVPRARWEETYRSLGFSEAAAASYARMTAATLEGDFDVPEESERGQVTLQSHIDALVSGGKPGQAGEVASHAQTGDRLGAAAQGDAALTTSS